MFRSVLVPMDFSECSVGALRIAVDVVCADGGSLTLLHVNPVTGLPPAMNPDVPIVPAPIAFDASVADERRRALERIACQQVPDVVKWHVRAREGEPSEEILAEAAAGGHDLIVMGTVGRSGLARLVLGSVAEHVLRGATIPVLVVRQPKAAALHPPHRA